MTALGNVPCNGCRACCLHDVIPLMPERGDLIWTYEHEVILAECPGVEPVHIRGFKGKAEIDEWMNSDRRTAWLRSQGYAK